MIRVGKGDIGNWALSTRRDWSAWHWGFGVKMRFVLGLGFLRYFRLMNIANDALQKRKALGMNDMKYFLLLRFLYFPNGIEM